MIADNPIRILHIVDTLGKGGLETGLVNLIQRLKLEFEHTVCAIRGLGENAKRIPADRVPVLCLGKTAADSRVQIATLARVIRQVRPEIVHSRNWGALEAVIAARVASGARTVHSEHGLDSTNTVNEPWRRVCFRRISYNLADRVVTVSHSLRDVHARNTGISPEKISVIHNGVDRLCFAADAKVRTSVRREFGLGDDVFCIGAVGNLFPVKDHATLLRAVQRFNRLQSNWRLLIIGEGPERNKLQAIAESDPDCNSRITFVGASDRVSELMQAMDVYVLSSVSEGISNSLLEAMATGVPVIATATGGTPEVVTEESGSLCPVGDERALADHLLLLRRDRERRVDMSHAAVRRVRYHFSLESMTDKYRELYRSLRLRKRSREQVRAA